MYRQIWYVHRANEISLHYAYSAPQCQFSPFLLSINLSIIIGSGRQSDPTNRYDTIEEFNVDSIAECDQRKSDGLSATGNKYM